MASQAEAVSGDRHGEGNGVGVALRGGQALALGTPLLKNQVGTALYLNGTWKVAIASFCGLAYLEYPKGSSQLPAVCRS